MLNKQFYNEAIRKTVVSFGTLFNNIELVKKDPATGTILKEEKVPIAYGPKSKFLARLDEDPGTARKVNIVFPRLSFELTGLSYDTARKTSVIQRYRSDDTSTDKLRIQYTPVPYNMEFDLNIISKTQDDALQILEQILAYFQPAFTISIKFIPEMEEVRDVAIVLNNISYDDDYEGDMLTRRSITYTLKFVAKSYIYGPVTTSDVIRKATVYETLGDPASNKRAVQLEYTPESLTDRNADGVIDAADHALLMPGDDFGFNEGITLLP